MFNQSFSFKGNQFFRLSHLDKNVADSFSYQCIILPEPVKRDADCPFLIAPFTAERGDACAGVIANGHEILVIEHGNTGYQTVLQAHVDVSTWVEMVLVYDSKKPYLYINGKLIAEGSRSLYNHVYPSGTIGGNENGECFKGKIRSIKLWNKSLNHERILQLHVNNHADDGEIVWSRNFLNGATYKNGKRFSPKVTVIMPTYNKHDDILMTLYSLECQTFHKSEFEIIICDDGSEDNTINVLNNSSFSFPITYIRSNNNIGRPNIRNLGLQLASGDIIVFLDAEILVKPDFIEQHYLAHMKKERLVVCGSYVLHGVYTKFYPDYSEDQKKHFEQILKENRHTRFNIEDVIKNNRPHTFLTKENVLDQSYIRYSFEKPFVQIYRDTLFNYYGNELTGFPFPWILFSTGNVSVKAEGYKEVGMFEEYPGYGWDDHEMGYRLFKKGYSFLNHTSLIGYHQEHPVADSNQMDAYRNFVRMFNKYPEIEMRIFALHFVGIEFQQLISTLESFQFLQKNYPNNFQTLKGLFHDILKTITRKLWNGETIANLADGSNYSRELAEKEADSLINIEKIKPFILTFKHLINL